MAKAWDLGRLGRIGLALALTSLLAPYLLGMQPGVVRAAEYSVSDFDISTRSSPELRPRIDGSLVAWQDYRNNEAGAIDENANADIFYLDLENGNDNAEKANEGDNNSKRPAVSGDVIVWTQDGGASGLNIEGYDISADDHFTIDDSGQDQDFADISGDVVVYQTRRGGNWDIRGYDIRDDDHFDIVTQSADQTRPAIDGNIVVWMDRRDGASRTDIFGYDLSTGTEFRVTDSHDAREPDVSGNYVVYAKGGETNAGIYVFNIADRTERQISSTREGRRGSPRISGTIVVWVDEREGDGRQDIWGYDLSTGQEFPVETQGDDQYDPDISGNTIVWTDERHAQDVRGGTLTISGLETPTPTPTATPTLGPTPPPGPPAPRDERFFPQTGFRIDHPTIWDYFNKRGGVGTFGYPISRTFRFLGFQTQFFQRRIVQIGPDGNARLLNLLDPGLMPVDRINFSTFPAFDPSVANAAPVPGSPGYDTAVLDFVRQIAAEQVDGDFTRFWTTFNNTVTCQAAFPNQPCQEQFLPGFNLEMWGTPTSRPFRDPNNGNFIYLRFQRGIMHYDRVCQCTQGILLASWFRDVITGSNLPADLDQQMAGTRFYRQYNNAMPLGLNRPNELPDTDLTNAFEPQ